MEGSISVNRRTLKRPTTSLAAGVWVLILGIAAVIVGLKTRNAIGWIFLAISLFGAIAGITENLAREAAS